MKAFLKLATASAVLLSGTAYASSHTSNFVQYGNADYENALNGGQPQAGTLNTNPQGLDALFDYTQAGGTTQGPSGNITHNNLGSRYRQSSSSPDDTVAATTTAGGTFTLTGKVNADCSFYNGSSSNHTIDLGTIGVRTGDNENVTVAFNQAATATAHVDTATAGCNTRNTVTIAEANTGKGLVNTAPGAYDSAQFTANIPYSLAATWTGAGTNTATGTTQSLSVAASGSGTNAATNIGAWRSAFNMDVTIPAQSLGLVAGTYSDKITVTLAVS